jgi:hypothetical protein
MPLCFSGSRMNVNQEEILRRKRDGFLEKGWKRKN